jgi:gamma-glutamyltranspeptidase/glutathione hydrolase
MQPTSTPAATVRSPGALVASADQLATQAGLAVLARGGNAVDAAIATNAAIAVTGPHLCGMGGDLFALVHDGSTVHALNASGRAGSGADPEVLRADGHHEMPFRHDIRTVTVPGCIDGWCTLHARFGRVPLAEVLAPAIALAEHGFPASPLLVGSLASLDQRAATALAELVGQARRPGDRVRRPGAAAALRAVAASGRAGFYEGAFGEGLLALGAGWYTPDDLTTPGADWAAPLARDAFGVTLHTIAPNSQGYLLLGSAGLAAGLDLPDDTDDPQWAHLLVECAKAAGRDRPEVLHDRADGRELVARIIGRRAEIDPNRAAAPRLRSADGDTTYLCAVDSDRMAVSLIQSNASGFGSWLVEPTTGINLHNRGLGFSLEAGHPAELGPGRRPPHTLAPALATRPDGSCAAVFGTMGGDGQPQILLQVAARLFRHGHSPGHALDAARWVLHGPTTGFDTWTAPEGPHLLLEGHVPAAWATELARRGHRVVPSSAYDSTFGHAHAIVVQPDGMLAGGTDRRARVGSVAGV